MDLDRAARRVLVANWRLRATVPAARLYPHQWSWDSAFVAIGLRHLSPARAQRELETLLGAQWGDGRIPHIVFDPSVPADAYFPGPSFWRSADAPDAPAVPTSGIVQPPAHALAAWETHRADPAASRSRGFLRRVYPRLVAWHAYLTTRRDLGGRGLVSVVHPWESGMDNSPAWDGPLAPVTPLPPTAFGRRDLAHAPAAERPTDADYGAVRAAGRRLPRRGLRRLARRARVRRGGPALQRAADRRRARAGRDRDGDRARSRRAPRPRAAADRRAGRRAVRPRRRHVLPARRAHRRARAVVLGRRAHAARRTRPAGRRRAGQDRPVRPVPAARRLPAAVVRPHRRRPRGGSLLARARLGEHELAVLARAARCTASRRSPTTCGTGCSGGCARAGSASTSTRSPAPATAPTTSAGRRR